MNALILFLPNHPTADTLAEQLARAGVTVHLAECWEQTTRLCRRNPETPLLAAIDLVQLDELWNLRQGSPRILMVAPSHTSNDMIGFGATAVIDPSAISAQAVIDAWKSGASLPTA